MSNRVWDCTHYWWSKNNIDYNVEKVELDKVLKFKKKNDTDKLLKYWEMFIQFMEAQDENVFGILEIVYGMEGKFGCRYRRKDAIYLILTIIETKFCDSENETTKKVFEFGKKMIFRKGMNERKLFCVWLVMLVWKFDELNFEQIVELNDEKADSSEAEEYLDNRNKILIDDDFVVKDHHVNKKYSIKQFVQIGALVVDEELSMFGENGVKYKNYYMDSKGDI